MGFLDNVVSGVIEANVKLVIHGPEGVGKTTFAAGAPSPIFICTEDGTEHLPVDRIQKPETLSDVYGAIRELTEAEHKYVTLVIDSLDWCQPIIDAAVCAAHGWRTLDEPGFGRGPSTALAEWRVMLSKLERLREKMHIVLIAHSEIKAFKNPVGDDYDRYQLKLTGKASSLVREWADTVLFATYESATVEKNGRAKGVSTGKRITHTEHSAGWDAKNRQSLPPTLPLDWGAFDRARLADHEAELAALLEAAGAKDAEKAVEWIKTQGNKAAARAAVIARLRSKLGGKK